MASFEAAEVSSLEKIRQDYLECSICQEEYTEPKVLDCLHSFCKHCLLEYHTSKYEDAKTLICPICQKETQLPEEGVKDLKTNSILTGLASQLGQVSLSQNAKLLCDLCEEKHDALHFCFDCPMFICASCYKMHQKVPASSSHKVATLKDIRDGKIAMKKSQIKSHPACQTHEGEVMRFYCTTCDVMICRDCTVIDHPKPHHEYLDCNQASSTSKQSLAKLFNPLEGILKNLDQSKTSVSAMKDNLDNAAHGTMAEVRNRADKIRAEIAAQESRIMDEIKAIQIDRCKKLEEEHQTVSVKIQQIQNLLQVAKDASNSSAPDFLALYPTISKDMKSLTGQNPPEIDSTLSHLRFNPEACAISLGNLKEPRWELCLKFDPQAYDIDASLPGDEVAVAEYSNKRVVIYNTKGDQIQTIQLSHNPQAVAAFQGQLVVVDSSNSVKIYNTDGTKGFDFYSVPHLEVGKTLVDLYSVAVMNDVLIVGDVKRSVITKHNCSDGSLINTVSVKTEPYFIAIDSNDRVVVSGGDKRVDIVDGNGATLVTIKPTINGQPVKYCRGVCCDSSYIYISVLNWDYNTGHIHRYDIEGRFLSCIVRGLYCPGGISLTPNGQQLAVADFKSVKIYNKV
ncbi:E3 ubiquitin-protein ligase TRIM56-like [Asterias rubens]|uniref:E3 ubiquitin-protein ligase TRIM56-like n=1 Tax=Asterias rubens TaxID=7604 RepID=UPI0014552817|nr:E3 ubiquitin-protein ligase TRIM56-like [Asterias rubens]